MVKAVILVFAGCSRGAFRVVVRISLVGVSILKVEVDSRREGMRCGTWCADRLWTVSFVMVISVSIDVGRNVDRLGWTTVIIFVKLTRTVS